MYTKTNEKTPLKPVTSELQSKTAGKTKGPLFINPPAHITYTIMVFSGIVFGFALSKGRVFEPGNIAGQMVFEKFIMFKMFFMAMISSLVTLSVLSVMPRTRPYFLKAVEEYGNCTNSRGLLMTSLGGLMLGTGMSIAGSCPGNVYIQMGGGLAYSWVTFIGGLLAAAVYSYVEPTLRSSIQEIGILPETFLHLKLNTPFHHLALPFACVLLVCVSLLEAMVPWETEVTTSANVGSFITWFSWPPMVSGLLVGILQAPIVLLVRDTVGGSSSFMSIVANCGVRNEHVDKFRSGMSNNWQVIYVLGAFLGGLFSSMLSHSYGVADSVDSFGWIRQLVGGFVMIFGARMAGGCTSGHGISGMGFMNLNSFFGVIAMFAGAIPTGLFIKYLL
ncbi:hypothetical protein SARC_01490 [Sphaeroforma arctica JP610]|uniref:Uncharacterized protein n=1 Tax=Sphaeroforma arctica JP610 TaxID=667725 RepID=A0A0L0GBF6_9EUKA|nr:hypothetical protein SARC_01490 [Sphaeroforma arctica JP610]KNC86357.1 hypothetical protein SARC_01490 [Sphaeroforma arctica JP610]|eukprot:XP_014160259.1 hypothetical protein SARC_01490 [Sphaeroforma arctica JP610]